MISYTDCLAFSTLTSEQIDAIACMRHVPEIVALEWCEDVLQDKTGCDTIDGILHESVIFSERHQKDKHDEWVHGYEEFHQRNYTKH